MSLGLYKKKRNFDRTPEPDGVADKKVDSAGFVVQRHDASHLHYDFRLEMDGVLKSWAVPKGPSMRAGEKRLAVMVEDHPLSYGKFYGEIPEGNYGAGKVDIWDFGNYRPLDNEPKGRQIRFSDQLKKGDLKFVLEGHYLKGAFALVRMNDGKEKNWLLIKKNDEYASDDFNIESLSPLKEKQSLNRKKVSPTGLEDAWKKIQHPMLAKLSDKIHDQSGWLYEAKYDGYRAVTKISGSGVEMISRNGNSFNKIYAPIVQELTTITDEVVLDGEIVIEDAHNVSKFQLLQNYKTTHEGTLKYYVFDVLYLNGFPTINLTLKQRRELLAAFFQNYTFKNILLSDSIEGKGNGLFKKLVTKGYEGIIAKDGNSLYSPGKRTGDWLKIKAAAMQEAVIGGYTTPQKSRKYFGSIILGMYEGDSFKYIGNCGTGFTDTSLKELHEAFEELRTDECPFAEKPVMTGAKGSPVWIKPELVCNIKYLEWTHDNHLRNPVFLGLRTDKEPKEIQKEVIPDNKIINPKKERPMVFGNKKVNCTNLDKIYWPDDGITKGDLIQYYIDISKYILPYLKNRPLSLNRHPNGIAGESFFQKDMDVDQLPSWAKTEKIHSKSNDTFIDYLVCNDVATLVYVANMGCIEINPWHSKYNHIDHPDYLILDLDPGDIAFTYVTDVAHVIKDMCDQSGIKCYCKTSGATGLHIYIPLHAKYEYEDVKTFAQILATLTHKYIPDVTSIERSVARRKDKIYVDFLQNRKGQTIAAPYCVRPRPHATISTPLEWNEVNHHLSPGMFTMDNIKTRLAKKGDLWGNVLTQTTPLQKVLLKLEKM